MREDEPNWFARWEKELPTPEELTPISQTLITPDLALAFDIRNPASPQTPPPNPPPPPIAPSAPSSQPNSGEFDSGELGSGGTTGDEPARTLKRPRLVWTPQLHKRFVDAVAHLGIKNAVPKTIMQLMSVDGLTRENVASHLQKYRLYLKRMQGLSAGGGGAGGGGLAAAAAAADPTTDHLFASSPVPPHFLHTGRANSDNYLPFVPVAALQHHQQQQQMAAAAAVQLQPQYHHHRQVGHFGSPPNGQFEHPFLSRQPQPVHRMGAALHGSVPGSYVEDLESATATAGRKALTLFPAGDD